MAREPLNPADIPVVILAGGFGMRLHEETERVPKPMVQIGTKPIMWHIMRHYSTFGFRRFMICLGYKSWVIKEYFLNYYSEVSDIRVHLGNQSKVEFLGGANGVEDWEVTLVETGLHSGSTGRLQGVSSYIDTPYFMYTYGDGVGPVDIDALHRQHLESERMVTVTGVKPTSRYGMLLHSEDRVTAFAEKPEIAEGYVSGGFFALSADLFPRLQGRDPEGFMEIDVLPELVREGEVGIHRHHGFWHSMDTFRDFTALNDMWASGDAPWRTWE